jgi:hypothetical protein
VMQSSHGTCLLTGVVQRQCHSAHPMPDCLHFPDLNPFILWAYDLRVGVCKQGDGPRPGQRHTLGTLLLLPTLLRQRQGTTQAFRPYISSGTKCIVGAAEVQSGRPWLAAGAFLLARTLKFKVFSLGSLGCARSCIALPCARTAWNGHAAFCCRPLHSMCRGGGAGAAVRRSRTRHSRRCCDAPGHPAAFIHIRFRSVWFKLLFHPSYFSTTCPGHGRYGGICHPPTHAFVPASSVAHSTRTFN